MVEVKEVKAKHKIQMQLGVPFFILAGFFVITLIFGTLYFGSGFGEENDNRVNSRDIAEEARDVFETYIDQMTSSFENALLALDSEDPEIRLREILTNNRAMLATALYDAEGSQTYELHKSRLSEDAILRLSDGALYLALVRNNEDVVYQYIGESLFYILYPTETNGVLVSIFSTLELENIFQQYGVDFPTKISIVDRQNILPLYVHNGLDLGPEDEGLSQENLRGLFENENTEYGYITGSGKRVRGYWIPIEGMSWVIMAEVPLGITTPVNTDVYYVSGIILLIFITLTFYFLYVFNEKLLKPLKEIEKIIHYYETGDYSESMDLKVENEFATFAQMMNSLARHVEGNTSERVAQLKKVLERQNTDTKLLIEKDIELREQGEKLKELDAAKSMFVSVAAHQMRTPLAAVKWALKLVMDGDVGPVNAEQIEYLKKGYDSTTRMIDLINDLLDVDKIESDKFTYTMKEEQLEDIVQGIIDDLTPIAIEKGVNLKFQKDANSYPSIEADQVKLRNALQNLIDNAIKYTIGGGDVTVSLHLEKDILKLSISDTGIGIPFSEQKKVFGKFFRAKNAVRQETDGSGLGLFIVKKIIQKHGGDVIFESKEGKGTTFFIEIPIQNNNNTEKEKEHE